MNVQKMIVVTACLVGLIGCKKTEKAPPVDVATPQPIDVPELTPMNESDVRGVLVVWESSQNQGDFAAYSKLFAPKFEGVKRFGPTISQFDQPSWLREQGEKFRNGDGVKLGEPSISLSGTTAVVRFTEQTTDKGEPREVQKVLVLEKSPNGTKIVREEVLQPPAAGPSESFDANRWVPVLLDEFLVLSDHVDESWLVDTNRLVGEGPMVGSVAVAETWVDVAKLPQSLRMLKGRTFSIQGDHECRATVQGFRVISRVTPHFSTVENWKERESTKQSKSEIAGEIVELASTSGRVLVAKLDKRCARAIWAQAAKDASDQIFTVEVGQPVGDEVLDSVRKSTAWMRLEEEASEYGVSDWFDLNKAKFTIFSSGKQRFGVLTYKTGEGCGEFYAEYSAIIDMADKPRLVHDIESGIFFEPKAMIGTSGTIVFVSGERAGRLDADGFKFVISWEAPYLDCRC